MEMVIRVRCLALWIVAGLLVGQASGNHPSAEGDGVRSLDVYGNNARLHLLTGETRAGEAQPQLIYTCSQDAGSTWSAPVRVDRGLPPGFAVNRGMDAQIAAAGEVLVAVWMTAGTDAWGGGPMATALSADGGKTWTPGPNPADDGSTTGHGFIDIASDAAGVFHLTWLDTRGDRGLRYARSSDGGKSWSVNQTLKSDTCECCWNAIATGAGGTVAVLFRNRSPRDMAVTISSDSGRNWKQGVGMCDFGWKMDGCPHVGGGLVFAPSGLNAVVWNGMAARAGVYHVFSKVPGLEWSTPRQLGTGAATHPDIAANKRRRVLAVFEDRIDGQFGIWAVETRNDGKSWSRPVRVSKEGAKANHPRVVSIGDGFRVFWTEAQDGKPTIWKSASLP